MNIIITGANSKIGRKLVPLLSKDNILSINDRSKTGRKYKNLLSLSHDLNSKKGINALLNESHEFSGHINGIINLTGYLSDKEFSDFPREEFLAEMNINLYSSYLMLQALEKNQYLLSEKFTVLFFTITDPEKLYKKITFHSISKTGLEKIVLAFNEIYKTSKISAKCIRLPDMQKEPSRLMELYELLLKLLKNPLEYPDILSL